VFGQIEAIMGALRISVLCLVGALTVHDALAGSPKLGTFAGKTRGTMGSTAEVRHGSADVRVTFRLRVDRGRLYVSKGLNNAHAGAPLKEFRQSFVVLSDTVREDGARVIKYERPADATRSGAYNVRSLNKSRAAQGNAQILDAMKGSGEVVIKDNVAEWRNVGTGEVGVAAPNGAVVRVPVAWDETFQGSR
jgi:hypothetical protein